MQEISRNQLRTLKKLSTVLNDRNIAFVIIGGLAAIAWGSKRKLVDIDILVSSKDFETVADMFNDEVKVKPRHYTKNDWDIQQFILELNGVTVDVCNGESLFFEKDGKRHKLKSYINNPTIKKINGLSVPVLPLNELIRYKRLIARSVDMEDLRFLEN